MDEIYGEIRRLESDLFAMSSHDRHEPCLRDGDTGTDEFIPGVEDTETQNRARKRLEEIAKTSDNPWARDMANRILNPPKKEPVYTHSPSSSYENSFFENHGKKFLIAGLVVGALYFAWDYYRTKQELREVRQSVGIERRK